MMISKWLWMIYGWGEMVMKRKAEVSVLFGRY